MYPALMDQNKRKRLQEAGWTIGCAKDFRGLSDEEEQLIDLRIALVKKVREARQSAAITQADLAAAIGSSQSRIAKLEAGEPNVSKGCLERVKSVPITPSRHCSLEKMLWR